jgi:tetratricopeptide (TPR) repeat protein
MPIREKYKLEKIKTEIENFEALIFAELFDEAVKYFREHLEKPTLFGLETSLVRANLLEKLDVEKLSRNEDKTFVLYALALTLNLTRGFPNRAIPLYEKHDELAEKAGDFKSLSQSLGHHAKALRQVGRFLESEQIARKGLEVIRERGDFLREAVNLYWLGMGLAHRGESNLSEIALQRSLRIFRAKFATQAEGVVNAFLAQRALWLEDFDEAFSCANRALEISENLENDANHADLHGAVKILTAAARMKGEALIFKDEGEDLLLYALKRAREIEFTEEELPALRALALLEKRRGNFAKARDYLEQSWELAKRGEFLLYNADSYNILAQIELAENNQKKAIEAARKAFDLSLCDGVPFAYLRGLGDAKSLLENLGANVPEIKICDDSRFEELSEVEINPDDEFEK